ncbi:hypothetical protein C2G38_2042214 [Gigaspora rosea]|uniref:Uncharacterized protein n=1 Tax=Gigaspora rosea TaxID=44941 RepID=A0A397UP06_9GLOM|nr:hypothetical protein C2G38_2042214 [Gigaspora rosea]
MITIPNECYYIIFNNFRRDYKSLFSCALVNRQWCRIIIPILWSEPGQNLKDQRLIRTFILMLNAEEQTLLIPFKITFLRHPKPLFEYTRYIISINSHFYIGIKNWLPYNRHEIRSELENAVKCSLIKMLLRTSKCLKYLYLDEIICNPLIFENLYKNSTIISIDLCLTYNISNNFKSKAIDGLIKILNKNSTLTSLNLRSILLGTKEMKVLLEALYKNSVLNSLGLCYIGKEEEKMLAKFLCKSTTLTSLSIHGNNRGLLLYSYPGLEGGKVLADALCKNNTLKKLNLQYNKLGPELGKALANALCNNTTLTSLNLGSNNLGLGGGTALADSLCKNTTLTSLDLSGNYLGSEGGKVVADALCENSALKDLSLHYNFLGSEGGKALANALCMNTTLISLNLSDNDLGSEGVNVLADALALNIAILIAIKDDRNYGLT